MKNVIIPLSYTPSGDRREERLQKETDALCTQRRLVQRPVAPPGEFSWHWFVLTPESDHEAIKAELLELVESADDTELIDGLNWLLES